MTLLAAGCLVAALGSFGCNAHREPVALIEPTYSYLHDDTQTASALPQLAASSERGDYPTSQ